MDPKSKPNNKKNNLSNCSFEPDVSVESTFHDVQAMDTKEENFNWKWLDDIFEESYVHQEYNDTQDYDYYGTRPRQQIPIVNPYYGKLNSELPSLESLMKSKWS